MKNMLIIALFIVLFDFIVCPLMDILIFAWQLEISYKERSETKMNFYNFIKKNLKWKKY